VQFSAIASGGILFALFSAPFWFAGYQLAGQALGGALTRERFAIGRKRWRLAQVGAGQASLGLHAAVTRPTVTLSAYLGNTWHAWRTVFQMCCGRLGENVILNASALC
jgi:hypothetical protein